MWHVCLFPLLVQHGLLILYIELTVLNYVATLKLFVENQTEFKLSYFRNFGKKSHDRVSNLI